jgi:hypothetical protein
MISESTNAFQIQNTFPSSDIPVTKTLQTQNIFPDEDIPVAKLIRFLDQMGLNDLLASVSDPRQQSKIKYSNVSLLKSALAAFLFRQESKNAFNSTILSLPKHKQKSMSKFLDVAVDSLPKRDCTDDYLSHINPDEINLLLIKIFKWAKKNKLFYNHAEKLLLGNYFRLAADGFWTNKYDVPHAVDENGKNCCPYCQPRVHNKGKPDEKTYYLHAFVTFVLVFPCGFKLPIYVYPLKAVQDNASKSYEKLKQECELQAAYKVLPELKRLLGRIPIMFLGDSLYAAEPMLKLLEQLNWAYTIVRKNKVFKSVGKKCDEFDKSEYYQKNCRDKKVFKIGGKVIEQSAKWFNNVAIGKTSYTNVLRFLEVIKNSDGSIVDEFYTELLISVPITTRNWQMLAEGGRMRWEHEDMHNSLRNRGFAASHDYARSNSNLCIIWKLLMFVAFLIFELFRITTAAKDTKGPLSWMKFAVSLLHQLVELSWDVISRSPILQKTKVQFRYDFATG